MTSEQTIDRRRSILRAKGVPEKFIEAIATRNDNRWAEAGMFFLALLLLVGITFAVTALATTTHPLIVRLMFPDVRTAFLFSTGEFSLWFEMATMLGMSLLVMFGSYLILDRIFARPIRPAPAYSSAATALRTLSRQTLANVVPDKRYQALEHLPDDAAFLEALRGKSSKAILGVVGIMSIFLLPASIILGLLSSQDYWLVKTDAVEIHQPGQAVLTYDLRHVLYGQAQCTWGRKGGFQYWLVFPGRAVDLWQYEQVDQDIDGPELTRRIGLIDQRLREAHIPVQRGGSVRGESVSAFRDCLVASYAFDRGGNADFLERLSQPQAH